MQLASTNITAGRFTGRELKENANKPALNEHTAETNYARGRN